VDAIGGKMTADAASKLLRSIHNVPEGTRPGELKAQVVDHLATRAGDPPSDISAVRVPILYVTCGWRNNANEKLLRRAVCNAVAAEGAHLVGDAEDHASTVEARIKSILEGCSAHLIIVPRRAGDGADQFTHAEYRHLRKELKWGSEVKLPQFIVAETGLDPSGELAGATFVDLRDGPDEKTLRGRLADWASDVPGKCPPPKCPHYVMIASDYEDLTITENVVRHIEMVTGLPCLKGRDFGGKSPARKIEAALRHAVLVIANIVSANRTDGSPDINWNSCIEAGIALGAGRPVQVIMRRGAGDTWTISKDLPFMLRDNQLGEYSDDQHLIGLIHKFARPYRRRVIAAASI
jgi:hypothetical protein